MKHNLKQALATAALLLCSMVAMAQTTATVDGITYEFMTKAKLATVVGTEKVGDIVIPKTVEFDGVVCNVTAIGMGAFWGHRGLTSVTIPNSVTTIGNNAFKSCSLTSVTIPSSVTTIEYEAFSGCGGLTSITIPSSVTTIEYETFRDCRGLTSLTIPNSVTTIGSEAFKGCSNLKSVTIPSSVTTIGYEAFDACGSLTAVHISDLSAWCNIDFGIYYSNPLFYAHKLYLNGELVTELVIPNDITEIKNYAFTGFNSLTNVTIGNSVTAIGNRAFYGCTGLTSVTIPNSVTTIRESAFQDCTGLESVTIPNNVTTIGGYAFYDCSSLTSVNIPNSVTTIGDCAFTDCTSLESVNIGNSVTGIEYYEFIGCNSLTSVVIGESVKTISYKAFANCGNLADVYCYATSVPRTESDAFENSYIEYATLHVPGELIDSYKNTAPWSGFGTIKAIDGDVPGTQTPVTPKCATPVITYSAGKLNIACDTEGAQFVTTITDSDIRTHYDSTIELTVTYNITTYATLAGYENSDTIQASLCWIDSTPTMEQIGTDISEIASTPVLVRSSNGNIFVSGATEGTAIRIYSADGMNVGSAVSSEGETAIPTTLQKGKIAIVAIGNSRIKMVVR